MNFAEWNCHRKHAAPSERAGHSHGSAMKPGQFTHQRQPNSRSLKCSPSRALDPVEALEDSRQLFRGYASAGIRHGKLHIFPDDAKANRDATLEGKLEGIGEKI